MSQAIGTLPKCPHCKTNIHVRVVECTAQSFVCPTRKRFAQIKCEECNASGPECDDRTSAIKSWMELMP